MTRRALTFYLSSAAGIVVVAIDYAVARFVVSPNLHYLVDFPEIMLPCIITLFLLNSLLSILIGAGIKHICATTIDEQQGTLGPVGTIFMLDFHSKRWQQMDSHMQNQAITQLDRMRAAPTDEVAAAKWRGIPNENK